MKYINRNTVIGILIGTVLGILIGALPIPYQQTKVPATDAPAVINSRDVAGPIEYFECPSGKDLIVAFLEDDEFAHAIVEGAEMRELQEFGGAPPTPTTARRYQTMDGYDPTQFIVDLYPDEAVIVVDRAQGILPTESTGYVHCAKVK